VLRFSNLSMAGLPIAKVESLESTGRRAKAKDPVGLPQFAARILAKSPELVNFGEWARIIPLRER
jgi:hypothetical protein